MIQEKITKLKEVVNQNSMGHLPLPYRVDLMKQIGNTLVVQKILCECCKKVYLLCEKMNGEKIPLHNILFDADKYLYKGKGTVESIFSFVEKWRNYAEQSIDSSEDMENWAIIALGYATRYDGASMLAIEDYYGEDDNAFDFESWNVDFICSIAYSGGNPFVEIGNVEKRKEYWLWYLDMVLAVYENPDKPYLKIKAPGKTALPVIIPERTQSWRVSNTSKEVERFINTLIQEVGKQTTSWDRITIEYTLILGCSITVFYHREDESNRIYCSATIHDLIADTLNNFQEKMYMQAPKEGVWMQCLITINKDSSYDISFNYDDITSISDIFNRPDWLVGVFEDYPRSKEYTPQWYRDMIGKRKLYLN